MNEGEDTMYTFLSRIANRTWLFVALAVLFVGMYVLMQVLFSSLLRASPVLPDARFFYTSGQLTTILDALGPSGRHTYMLLHLVDMVFPLVYGLFLAVMMAYLWGVRGGAVKAASPLSVLALAAALCDYAENICVRIVSALFVPGRTAANVDALRPLAASLAGFATAAKWTLSALSVVAILAGVVFAIVRRGRPAA